MGNIGDMRGMADMANLGDIGEKDNMVFIVLPGYLYWCHGIYISTMLFRLVLWYFY